MQGFSIARRDGHPYRIGSPHTHTHTHTHTLHRIVQRKVAARRSPCRTGFQSGCRGRRVCPISPSGAQPEKTVHFSAYRQDGQPDRIGSPHTHTHTHTRTLHRIVHPKVAARRSLCRTGFQSGCSGRRVRHVSPVGT